MDSSILTKKEDLLIVQNLAYIIWPFSYSKILSADQIAYMLDKMYSETELSKNFDKGHIFHLFSIEGKTIGFSCSELNFPVFGTMRIHKLYLLPTEQEKGFGRKIIEFLLDFAKKEEMQKLHLNVNRFNDAYHFYKALGFTTEKEENIDIGNGFLMEDYVMELKIDKYQR
ncbi:MAG: GNAT family N-acetyltransferase [Bacteroidetes bacterium]|nr:GNAT family N-acetyltransferase [Bacteroidota bacterium]